MGANNCLFYPLARTALVAWICSTTCYSYTHM